MVLEKGMVAYYRPDDTVTSFCLKAGEHVNYRYNYEYIKIIVKNIPVISGKLLSILMRCVWD